MFNIGDTVQVSPTNLPPGWEPWAGQVGTVTELLGLQQGPLGDEMVYIVHNDTVGDMTLYEGDLILVTPSTTPATTLGALVLIVSPSSAVVYVNNQAMSPGTYTEVVPGTYSWEAAASGYTTQSGTFTIIAGQTTNLSIILATITATTPGTVTTTTTTTKDWSPMSPLKGPPLPTWLGIYWPWVKAG